MKTALGTIRIMGIMGMLGLLVGAGIVGRSSPVEAAGTAVSVGAPAEVVKASSFTVSVNISDVAALDAGQFDVSFNPSLLQMESVTAGQIGGTEIPVDLWNEMSAGTCRVIVNVPGVPGVSGSGTLAVLHFQAASSAAGSSAIGLSNGFLNNNLATQIPATWTGGSVTVCDALVISTASTPDAEVGAAYSAALAAAGGSGSYAWSVVSGSLPGGLAMDAAGCISGTPTAAGDFAFTVQVTDGYLSTSKSFTIHVDSEDGDANADGLVNSADITAVERIIVGLDVATPGADVNGDGLINTADITSIERIIAGLS